MPVSDGKKGRATIKKKAEESTATKNAAQYKKKHLSNVSINDGSWQGTNKGFLDLIYKLLNRWKTTLCVVVLGLCNPDSTNWNVKVSGTCFGSNRNCEPKITIAFGRFNPPLLDILSSSFSDILLMLHRDWLLLP